jgi:hypothetical protein
MLEPSLKAGTTAAQFMDPITASAWKIFSHESRQNSLDDWQIFVQRHYILARCPRPGTSFHRMATPVLNDSATSTLRRSRLVRFWTIKIVALVLFSVLLGVAYDWSAKRYYGPDRVAGFHSGLIHGAMMPAALPALLMGNDLPIYAPNNVGRGYNIGFILGINTCGTLFFGIAFWRPRNL